MNSAHRWKRWRAVLDGFEDPEQRQAFLPRAEFELEKNYDCRIALSQFLGISGQAVEQLVGAVMGQDPVIEVEKALEDFRQDVDGNGTTIEEYAESVAIEAVAMGIAYIVVDGPSVALEEPARTRMDEIAAGANKAYLSLLKAEDLINWDTNAAGKLNWAMFRQHIHEQDEATDSRRCYIQLTLYDTSTVRRWRLEVDENGHALKEGDDFSEVAIPNPNHDLGEVPVFPVYGRRVGPMQGDSIIKDSSRADIAAYNDESWSAMARYRHANPILKMYSSEHPEKLFSGNVVRLKRNGATGEDEDLEYVELSQSSFEARENAIERYRRSAVTLSGLNPQVIPDAANSTTGESGIAQRVRFSQTQKRQIDRFSRKFENTLERVMDAAEKWITNASTPTPKTVRFRSSFEYTEADDMLRRIERVDGLIPSPVLIREMMKDLASKLVDLGDEAREEVMQEIDAADLTQREEEPDFGA